MVTIGGFGAYGSISIYKGNQAFYKDYVVPLIHLLDPEQAHNFAVFAGKYRLLPRSNYIDPDLLVRTIKN